MKIALAQINQTVGDFNGNQCRIEAATNEAQSKGAALCVFPEMAVCGCYPRDLLHQDKFVSDNLDMLDRLAAGTKGIGMIIGYVRPSRRGPKLENAAALIADGEIVSTHVKQHLANHGFEDESRFFVPGETVTPVTFKGVRLGITLCEDICDPAANSRRLYGHLDPASAAVQQGAEVIINLSARPYAFGTLQSHRALLKQCAVTHRRPVVYTNLVGGNDEFVFDGGSIALDPDGAVIESLPRFETAVSVADINQTGVDTDPPSDDIDQLVSALTLGTRDYLRDQGLRKLVTVLNGSPASAVGTIIAADAVGKENLTTFTLWSDATEDSIDKAASLANTLGVRFHVYKLDRWMDSCRAEIAHLAAQIMVKSPDKPRRADDMAERMLHQIIERLSGDLFVTSDTRTDIVLDAPSPILGGWALLKDVQKSLLPQIADHLQKQRGLPPGTFAFDSNSTRYVFDDGIIQAPYADIDKIITLYLNHGYAPTALVSYGFDAQLVQHVVERIQAHGAHRRALPPGIFIQARAEARVPIVHKWTVFNPAAGSTSE